MAGLIQHLGTGRRKTAVARIFLRSGKGQITVNGRSFENYFVNEAARALVRQPLLAAEVADKFDILILADGGGPHGQAGAARLGIARALLEFNAEKIKLTGRKEQQKLYRRHSGYPGGLTEVGAAKLRATRPTKMIEHAISGMLPKTKLGKQMYRKLKVYAGDKHPHQAQQPVALAKS